MLHSTAIIVGSPSRTGHDVDGQSDTLSSRGLQIAIGLLILWHTFQFWIIGKYSANIVSFDYQQLISHLMAMAPLGDQLWYPGVLGGIDRLAFGWAAPGAQWLFSGLPGWAAYAVLRLLICGAAIGGTYGIIRVAMPAVGPFGAFFAAFATGQYTEVMLQQSIFSVTAWSVLLLAALLAVLADGTWRNWLGLALAALVMSMFSSIAYLVVFPPVFVGLAVLVLGVGSVTRKVVLTTAVFVLIYLLRAADIWAMLVQVPGSFRPLIPRMFPDDLPPSTLAMQIGWHAIRSYWANIDLLPASLLSVGLSLVGLLGKASVRRVAARGWAVFLLCGAVETGLVVASGLLSPWLPFLRSFSALYLYMFANLALFWSAAAGCDVVAGWSGRLVPGRHRRLLMAAPILVLGAFSLSYKLPNIVRSWLSTGSFVRQYDSPVLSQLASILAENQPSRVLPVDIDNILQGAGFEIPIGLVPLYPLHWNLFWKTIVGPSLGQDADFDSRVANGYELQLRFSQSIEPAGRPYALGDHYRLELFSLANTGYVVSRTPLTDPCLEDLGLGQPTGQPWATLTEWQRASINSAENFSGRRNLYVYRNRDALARARLVEQLEVVADREAVFAALGERQLANLAGTALVSADPSLPAQRHFVPGSAIVETGADSAVVHLRRDRPGDALLVVANSYSPYWKAESGGTPLPIFAAYGVFWGVVVPEGIDTVHFSYRPPYRALPTWLPPFR